MNQWWHALSTKQKKQFKRRTITAMKSGADQNTATSAAASTMGYQAPAAPAAAAAPKAPAAPSWNAVTYKSPTQKKATQTQAGKSPFRGAKDSETAKKVKLSSLRIKRDRKRKTEKKEGLTAGSASGTGLNIGGY